MSKKQPSIAELQAQLAALQQAQAAQPAQSPQGQSDVPQGIPQTIDVVIGGQRFTARSRFFKPGADGHRNAGYHVGGRLEHAGVAYSFTLNVVKKA